MEQHLFYKVNIKKENIMLIDRGGRRSDQCRDYDRFLEQNEIDILVLGGSEITGISALTAIPCICELNLMLWSLEEETIKQNSRFFGGEDEVPKKASRWGWPGLPEQESSSDCGRAAKAEAIGKLLADDYIDPMLPCSI